MAAVKSKKPTKAPSKKLKAGKKKPLNKWLILGGVVAVAVIGAVVVRFSSAGSIKFLRPVSQITGNEFLQKGVSYNRITHNNQPVATLVSSAEMKKSGKVCTKVYNFNSQAGWTAVYIQVWSSTGGGRQSKTSSSREYVNSKKIVHVCAPVKNTSNAVIKVGTNDNTSSQNIGLVGISGIYGM